MVTTCSSYSYSSFPKSLHETYKAHSYNRIYTYQYTKKYHRNLAIYIPSACIIQFVKGSPVQFNLIIQSSLWLLYIETWFQFSNTDSLSSSNLRPFHWQYFKIPVTCLWIISQQGVNITSQLPIAHSLIEVLCQSLFQ